MIIRHPRRWIIAGSVLLGLMLAGFLAFLHFFPWAFDNQAEPGVEGPAIPVISMTTRGDPALDAYARTCSYCHDYAIGPDLRGTALDAESIKMMVRYGNGPMPAFRESEIADKDLDALAKIIAGKKLPQVTR